MSSSKRVPDGNPTAGAVPVESGAGHLIRRDRQGAFAPASFDFVVRPHDIAGAVDQLRLNGQEGSWIAFLFGTAMPSARTGDRSLALQYSVIDGRVGLDWVLLGARNVADEAAVAAFSRHRGHQVDRCEMNDVGFLRVEDGDLAQLGRGIVQALYGADSGEDLGLVIDGLVLSRGRRAID